MDDRSFDRLARILGEARDRRTGLKALVGGILGAGGMAALDADADAKRKGRKDAGPDAGRKKKKKKCNPACDAGFTCVKGRCTCAGVACGTACCANGQVCRDGACAEPRPTCLPFGAECKNVGRRCCDGLTCGSGQDGSYPVTCLRAKGAACAGDAECPFGTTCIDGTCQGGGGSVPTGASCANGETCAQPGATCTAYTTPGAPGGEFCTLPLRKVCTGNPECSCYNCWYVRDGVDVNGRRVRDAAPVKACIQPTGGACTSDADCARGLTCNLGTGTCGGGTQCAPAGAPCGGGVTCCDGSCTGGVCPGGGGGGGLGVECTTVADCPSVAGVGCVAYASAVPGATAQTYCLLSDGTAATNRDHCVGKALDLDDKCRTCTIYHGSYTGASADADALAALKTAIENPTGPNPVYVGTGLYKPASGTGTTALITVSRGTTAAPLQIFACLDSPGRPVIDGGATVTKTSGGGAPAPTDNARDLTWANGYPIMAIAAGASGAEKAVEIAGIDLQHGNQASGRGAAIFVPDYASLSLESLSITRCKASGDGGAINLHWVFGYVKGGSATLRGVTITQCNSGSDGGAINHSGLALKIEGSSTEKCFLTYNYAGSNGGAISTDGNNATLGSSTELEWTNLVGNIAGDYGGAINCNEQERNGIKLTDVLIDGNKALSASGGGSGGGISLESCGYNWVQATDSKNSFTRVDITNNQAGDGPGGMYINQDPNVQNPVVLAPLDFVDSNVTGNKALNWSDSDTTKVNGAYSNYGLAGGAITCSRTSGSDKTFRDNTGLDCTYDTVYSNPYGSGCCATTTGCAKAVCNGTCCATATTCTGSAPGPYTC